MGFSRNMGILLLSMTVILGATTLLTTQTLDRSSTNDTAYAMGHVTLTVLNGDGDITSYTQADNVIVADGWDALVQTVFTGLYEVQIAGDLDGEGGAPFNTIAVGTSPNAALADEFGLVLPLVGCADSTLDIHSAGAGFITNAATINVGLFASFLGSNVACVDETGISEAGIFNVNGDMFARNVFPTVPELGVDDTLLIDWDITFTGAAGGPLAP